MFKGTHRVALTGVSVIAILATTIGMAVARSDGQGMQGGWSATNFTGEGCNSPLGVCSRGSFSGTLHGPIDVVAIAFEPAPTPNVLIGVGDVVIHDTRGDVRCTATIVANEPPDSDGEEGWICQLTGGTRHWAGATGHIEAYGTAPTGGRAVGRYSGELTLP